jgi:hypothetical protein
VVVAGPTAAGMVSDLITFRLKNRLYHASGTGHSHDVLERRTLANFGPLLALPGPDFDDDGC